MRFILTENNKHLLIERFILQESDATPADIAAVETALANLDSKLSGAPNPADILTEAEAAVKADIAQVKPAQDAIKNIDWTVDIARAKKQVHDFLDLFIKAITPPGKNATDAENRLKLREPVWNSYKRLKDIADNKERADINTPNYSDTNEVEKLKDLYSNFRNEVNAAGLFDHTVDNWPEFKKAIEALEAPLKQISDGLTALTNKQTLDYDFGGLSAEALQRIAKAAEALTNALPADWNTLIVRDQDSKIDITETIKQCQAFTSGGAVSAANNFAQAITLASEERALTDADNNIGPAGTDWEAEFNKAGKSRSPEAKLKAVWARYWKTEWGQYAKQAQQLGTIFSDALVDYGFTATKNPWVAYAKYCFTNGINLTNTTLNGVMHAHERGLINNNALRQKDILSQNNSNVLYCRSLYSQGDGRVLDYLNLQRQITSQYTPDLSGLSGGNTFNDKYANTLTAAYTGSAAKACCLITSIMNAKYNALTNRATSPANMLGASLKDLQTAFDEFKACFGKDAVGIGKDKPIMTDANIMDIVSKNSNRMPQLITYYILAFQKDTTTSLAKEVSKTGFTGLVYPRFDEAEAFGKTFNTYKIEQNNVVSTLKKLLAAAKSKNIQGFENINVD